MRTLKTLLLACTLAPALIVAGCQSSSRHGGPVPEAYLTGTTLDRNPISVAKRTQYLEVSLNPLDGHLRLSEIEKIRGFVAQFRDHGHGPLIMSLPKNHANEELAVKAVAEAREIAWSQGVDYQKMQGSAYDAAGQAGAPVILAFLSYEAIAPYCPQKSAFDFANATSNNDMSSLGCTVRTNMAAMIADPADVLGNRPLDASDRIRREIQLELYRNGESTASQPDEQASGAVSTAVN